MDSLLTSSSISLIGLTSRQKVQVRLHQFFVKNTEVKSHIKKFTWKLSAVLKEVNDNN